MRSFALIGEGISYSLSPLIHNELYKMLGIKATFELIDVPSGAFDVVVPTLLKTLDGFSVTKPYKQRIISLLDGADCLSVNTVYHREGRSLGTSTDGGGFDYATRGIDLNGKQVLLHGAGGAAYAVAERIKARGGRLVVYNRTTEKAATLASAFGGEVYTEKATPAVYVSCVSVANEVTAPSALDFSSLEFVFDAIYKPTALLRLAQEMGIPHKDGAEMLVYQALLAEKIWLDVSPSEELANELIRLVKEAV